MSGHTKNRLLGIPVLAGSGTWIAQTMWNIGVSAHTALLLECNAAEKSPGKEGGLHWARNARIPKEVFFTRGLDPWPIFFFNRRSTPDVPCAHRPVEILPPPLTYINTLSCGLPIPSTSCQTPLPSGSSVSLPLLFARPGISLAARLALMR